MNKIRQNMRRIQIIVCLLLTSLLVKGQHRADYTDIRNYTAEKTYLDATSQVGSSARIINDITYTDGFGRKW